MARIDGQNSSNRSAARSRLFAFVGVMSFFLLFAVVWGPYYIFGIGTQFLYPVWAPLGVVVWAIALLAVIHGAMGLSRASALGGAGRGSALRGMVVGVILLVLALPVLWFGDAPLVLARHAPDEPGVLRLTAGEFSTGPCTSYNPVHVSSLNTDSPLQCEPQGAELVFPDGTRLMLPNQGVGTGSSSYGNAGDTYAYVGVGIYGIYATQSSADCSQFQEWGSLQAREKVRDAFGDRYGCE